MTDPVKPPLARLLIVDDEVAQMTALCHTLEDEGYKATGFTSGKAALEAMRKQEFDVVLTDLMMPSMDGIAFLTAGREIDPDLVGIVMTGHGAVETAVQAMQAGALDYIQKPFKLRQVLPVLTRALTVRRLRSANSDLEQRVRQRSLQLESANKELEAFSYSVSHDLRSPLRIISGYAEFLAHECRAQLSTDAQHAADGILASSQRMGRLITDLLELARFSLQALALTEVSMAELAKEVLDDLLREQADRKIAISVGELQPCRGDASLLRQVLTNLLSNAFKFTAQRADASIELGSFQQESELVYFVRDNGAGFDMTHAGKLFGAFQRLHGAEQFAGTGIGLTIVQRIVSRHGGRVWAEGELGKGAAFFFALPLPNASNS